LELNESVANHDRQLERLRSSVEATAITARTAIDEVRCYVHSLQAELESVKSKSDKEHETLVARLGTVERTVSLLNPEFDGKISDSLSAVTRRLSACEESITQMKAQSRNQSATLPKQTGEVPSPAVGPVSSASRLSPIPPLRPAPAASPSKSLKAVEFPLKEAESVHGIISYLTRKHGGNVHDKGIVTITSKSVISDDPKYAARNVADLTYDSDFCSKNESLSSVFCSSWERGQWICWDFRNLRVRPTHYTIKSFKLKSWVVESSLGERWTEIDRKTDNEDFNAFGSRTASFAVSKSAECRFIRLRQTGEGHGGKDHLEIRAFEVFGTLLE
jgi:hypothetical protein